MQPTLGAGKMHISQFKASLLIGGRMFTIIGYNEKILLTNRRAKQTKTEPNT